jgi:predicted O-methyltransferase YrrM
MMAILAVLCALNLALLAVALVMLRRMRRRMKKLRRTQRSDRRHPFWPQFESLMGLYRLLDGRADLPSLRLRFVSPDFLLHVVRHIQQHAPKRIVECGSGSSTIAMAQALRAFGIDGHIYSIENYEPSVASVRDQLRRHDLERFVTLVFAPLVPRRYDGVDAPIGWYDLGEGSIPGDIDMLLVDGPIAVIRTNARYPAGPELLPKLSRSGRVFVDDANRPGEKRMVERWRKLYPHLDARTLPAEKGCLELFFVDGEAVARPLSAPA